MNEKLSLQDAVQCTFGGIGAISPPLYEELLRYIGSVVDRKVDDEFRQEVQMILKSMPCPFD